MFCNSTQMQRNYINVLAMFLTQKSLSLEFEHRSGFKVMYKSVIFLI